jgi:tetratricopeptide (TPR) repeat protein
MNSNRNALIICGVLLLSFARDLAKNKSNYPPPNEIKPFKTSSLEDATFLSFGLRRLGADINFIRLLQYYGTPEHYEGDGHDHSKQEFSEYYVYGFSEYEHSHAEGTYPELFERTKHILSLDPYFKYAVLYSTGSLAFNLGRPKEALDLLYYARKHMPKDYDFDSYIAAIGYSKSNNPMEVANSLDKVLDDPECPTRIKQMAAFLNKKIKRYKRAYEIYHNISVTSKENYYIENSLKQMRFLKGYINK